MVAIKDMKMPKNCAECKLFHFYFDVDGAIHCVCKCRSMEIFSDLNKRNEFCPLIEADKETSDDCISRQDAIGIVARIKEMHIDNRERHQINYGTICDIDLALQQLPSVTPSYNSIKTELKPCEDCISREEVMKCFKKLQP